VWSDSMRHPRIMRPDRGRHQRLVLSAAHDQTVRVWDVESGACVRILTGHSAGVVNAVWGSGGRVLSCDWNGEVRVWELGA
jgi:WD40 repeat protein